MVSQRGRPQFEEEELNRWLRVRFTGSEKRTRSLTIGRLDYSQHHCVDHESGTTYYRVKALPNFAVALLRLPLACQVCVKGHRED